MVPVRPVPARFALFGLLALLFAVPGAVPNAGARPILDAPYYGFAGPVGMSAVETGDFDGDGHLDVVGANRSLDQVLFYRGNGDGTLLPPRISATGDGPWNVAVADLNRDGRLDLVTANAGSQNLSVLLGNGNGTFAAPATLPGDPSVFCLAIGDINGDGNPDVAASNYFAAALSVHLGNGDGTFRPRVIYPLAGWFELADMNLDGRADLVRVAGNQLFIHFGASDGSFVSPETHPAPDAYYVTVADPESDGTYWVGVTARYLTPPPPPHSGPPAARYRAFTSTGPGGPLAPSSILEFDGLGWPDGPPVLDAFRVVEFPGTGPVCDPAFALGGVTLLELGPTFTIPRSYRSGGAWGANPLAKGDMNEDGKPDLVEVGELGVSVMLNDGSGGFGVARELSSPGGFPAIADLDADGRSDLAVQTGSSAIGVFRSLGGGAFASRVDYPAAANAGPLEVADVDRDGDADLVVVNGSFGSTVMSVSVFRNRGNGTFDPRTDAPIAPRVWAMQVGDVNGDGVPDVTTFSDPGNLQPGSLDVLPGDGAGGFLPAIRTPVEAFGRGHRLGDLDGDGRLDVALYGSWGVLTRLGPGNGTFGAPSFGPVTYPTGVGDVRIADFTADGIPDLLVAENAVVPGDVTAHVFAGDGDGGFAAVLPAFPIQQYLQVVKDLDGDGRLDLIGLGFASEEVRLGRSATDFGPPIGYGPRAGSCAVGDLDGQRGLDLAVGGSAVSLLFSNVPTVGVGGSDGLAPAGIELSRIAPLPSTGETSIAFALPSAARATLVIYDACGRRVRTLFDGERPAGAHRMIWRGERDDGSPASPGVYFVRLESGGQRAVRRAIRLR